MSVKSPTLTEIASRISAHLQRFERDAVINAERFYSDQHGKRVPMGRAYYSAGASRAGSRVRVRYIAYQGGRTLTRSEAERYLAWLDAGNIGRHYEALREPS
jgi:hypothetical protein